MRARAALGRGDARVAAEWYASDRQEAGSAPNLRSQSVISRPAEGDRVLAARARVLHHDRDRDAGCRGGSEAHEPGMRRLAGSELRRAALARRLHPADLGAAGIGTCEAALHRLDHRVLEHRSVFGRHDAADGSGLHPLLVAVLGHQPVDQGGLHQHAIVRDGGGDQCHLKGRGDHLGLSVGGVGQLDPVCEPVQRAVPAVDLAGRRGQLEVDGGPEAEARRDRRHRLGAGLQAGVREPDVAGHLHRLVEVEGVVELHRPVGITDAEAIEAEAASRLPPAGRRTWCRCRWPPTRALRLP